MEPNQFQNIQSQNMNMDTSEPKPEERLFCERSFEEVEDGFYDDRGFYTTPNGSFWDDEHNYFNHLGYDKYGGSYDKYGVYQPGNGFNENTGFYKEQEELINNVDMKENDNEKIVKECIDKLKSQQGKDEQIVQRYDNLEEESEDDEKTLLVLYIHIIDNTFYNYMHNNIFIKFNVYGIFLKASSHKYGFQFFCCRQLAEDKEESCLLKSVSFFLYSIEPKI